MNGSPATSQHTEARPLAVLLDSVGVTGVCGRGEAGRDCQERFLLQKVPESERGVPRAATHQGGEASPALHAAGEQARRQEDFTVPAAAGDK